MDKKEKPAIRGDKGCAQQFDVTHKEHGHSSSIERMVKKWPNEGMRQGVVNENLLGSI